MGDGTKENPYTREDVLKKIEENGGTAEGLDLSGKVFEEGIDLRELNLEGIILRTADLYYARLELAYLHDACFEGANLMSAHLEKANLWDVHLEGTFLHDAHLEGAYLVDTHLEGAFLLGAKFSPDTSLEGADWGSYSLGEEKTGTFDWAAGIYRRLKIWYTNAGMYDIATEFYYHEMEAKRKRIQREIWQQGKYKNTLFSLLRLKGLPWTWIWAWIYRITCGYGERPRRPLILVVSVVFGSALVYFLIGSVWEWSAFWNSLYFSAVSFTALGYGNWVNTTNDWIRVIGAFESFIGVFTIALFLITFVRKMTR